LIVFHLWRIPPTGLTVPRDDRQIAELRNERGSYPHIFYIHSRE
jgi:hypothetical protein